VAVVLADECRLGAVLPRVPDGAHRLDVLAHARHGRAPTDGEALLVVLAHLAAEAEHEASLGEALQIPGDLRDDHRGAWKGDRHGRTEPELGGVLGGDGERQEGIAGRLGSDRARIPERLDAPRRGGYAPQIVDWDAGFDEDPLSWHALSSCGRNGGLEPIRRAPWLARFR